MNLLKKVSTPREARNVLGSRELKTYSTSINIYVVNFETYVRGVHRKKDFDA